ncbi:hypothetical protein Cch01nite_30750 [Cellulomonas chitinilytica]|uniref:Uncharacterized protein n=1 Tax=Cellulomonas chitinilytica TaxID=398759 RepID=A0A919P673_9CELL|nr:hypothetical protein [Cellulomonas chitinilytica]GIG22351.1 hypothetical protein Cch01nite_30750 [Cellulomonas chitinilytica]
MTNDPVEGLSRPPVRAYRRGTGGAFALLVASGAAIVGIVALLVAFVSIGVTTLNASRTGGEPCLEAYAADTDGAYVRYQAFPPKAVCEWDVDGTRETVVVASASGPWVAVGGVLAVAGVVTSVALVVVPRVRRRRAAAA